MGRCEQVVLDAHFLEVAGMTEQQLRGLHHRPPGRHPLVTFRRVYNYFGDSKSLRDNNTAFARRLHFVADNLRSGGTDIEALVAEALTRWPI